MDPSALSVVVSTLVAALATGSAMEAARAVRQIASRRRQQAELRVENDQGEVVYDSKDVTVSVDTVEAKAQFPKPTVKISSGDLRAPDVVAIVNALSPQPRAESWLVRHGTTVLAAALAALATFGSTVWVTAHDDASPDCVAYVRLLMDVETKYAAALPSELFGSHGALMRGDQRTCGDAVEIVDRLRGVPLPRSRHPGQATPDP